MRKDEADISVVVPLYNHEKYAISALESVFAQTARPREVIVVDDGSTDGSYEAVRNRFGNESSLILWTKSNSGAHNTINAGIHRATSSNIAILNSDDVYEPDRFEICLGLLERHKEADMVCTGIAFIDGAGRKIRNEWYEQALKHFQTSGDLALSLINGNFLMTTSNFVIRRAAIEKYGYFGNFRYAHDLAFLLRVLAQQGQIHIDSRPLLHYRIHNSNTISEGVLKVKVELAAVVAEYVLQLFRSNPTLILVEYLQNLYEVLDQHNLSRMLFPLMAGLSVKPEGGADKLLANADFFKLMQAISK